MKQVQHQIVDMTRISGLTNSTRLRIWQPLHSGTFIENLSLLTNNTNNQVISPQFWKLE